MEQKIPKIIHYCWFGGKPKPQLVQKCIASWEKFCPDYKIIEWNEQNFDIRSFAFAEEAYQAKKWAFVADCARAAVLLNEGGVYLDTDMELLQPLDPLLDYPFFAGFEAKDSIGTGIIGCSKGNEVIKAYLEYYKDKHFCGIESVELATSPIVLTETLKERGFKLNGKRQFNSNGLLCKKTAFFPTGLDWVFDKYGPKTISVHHFLDSWGKNNSMGERTRKAKFRLCLLYHARNMFGTSTIYKLGKRMREKAQ